MGQHHIETDHRRQVYGLRTRMMYICLSGLFFTAICVDRLVVRPHSIPKLWVIPALMTNSAGHEHGLMERKAGRVPSSSYPKCFRPKEWEQKAYEALRSLEYCLFSGPQQKTSDLQVQASFQAGRSETISRYVLSEGAAAGGP